MKKLIGLLLLSLWTAMAYEGAGVQIFKDDTVLMVNGARSARWGFPKGHREPFDTGWRDTAVREVMEETGFIEGINYKICDGIIRPWGTRLYWTAHVLQDRVPVVNTTEHNAVEWVPIQDLDQRRITRDVEEWIMDGSYIECYR